MVSASIRDGWGRLDGVERVTFTEIQGGPGGRDITVEVSGDDVAQVAAVVEEGATPKFGEPDALDFGGRGVRSIEYSPAHGRYFVPQPLVVVRPEIEVYVGDVERRVTAVSG